MSRACPTTTHALRTVEGARVWDAVRRSGAWSGGGMVPLRIDRVTVLARLDDIPDWIVVTLLDAFEPAALAARDVAETKKKRRRPEGGDEAEGDDE